MPDFDALEAHGVVAEFDFEGAQSEVHFKEFFAKGHGAVFANDALGARVEEWVDLVGLFDGAQRMGGAGEALVRTHAGGAVDA